jgi:RNA polymerase sigma-70 factor (ECF subfamily)
MAQESPPDAHVHAPPPVPLETVEREAQLVAAILKRDRKAAAVFVEEYSDSVYGYVHRRLAPRADLVDDLVQDVFVAALTGLRTFRGSSSLRSWLLGIARHKVEDYYRRRLREPGALPEDGEGDEPSSGDMPVDEVFDRERAEARTPDVLRQLPESYSLALLWRYWENRSVREMAGATGKTEKAIERLLARARERFRSLWSQRHG